MYDKAIKEAKLQMPKHPGPEASLEQLEIYENAVDEYNDNRSEEIMKIVDRLTTSRREKVVELSEEDLLELKAFNEDILKNIRSGLIITDLKIIHLAEEYPITPKEHGPDYLLKLRHLWLRSKRQQAIMRIRAELIKAIHDFFDNQGFILLDAPILTPSSCDSEGNRVFTFMSSPVASSASGDP